MRKRDGVRVNTQIAAWKDKKIFLFFSIRKISLFHRTRDMLEMIIYLMTVRHTIFAIVRPWTFYFLLLGSSFSSLWSTRLTLLIVPFNFLHLISFLCHNHHYYHHHCVCVCVLLGRNIEWIWLRHQVVNYLSSLEFSVLVMRNGEREREKNGQQ